MQASKGKHGQHAAGEVLSAYDYGAMLFHWLIALLIIVQLVMGYAMQRVEAIAEPGRFVMMQWHKTFGILVLILTLARIFWRFANPPPEHAPMPALELMGARIVSFLFYALMLLVPLTGWWLVSVSPIDIATLFFTIPGLEWPHLPLESSEAAGHLASLVHRLLSYGFLLLLFLHVGGALKHVVIDHIPEMARIVPGYQLPRKASSPASRRFVWGMIVVLTLLGLGLGQLPRLLAPASTAGIEQKTELQSSNDTALDGWVIDYDASILSFGVDFSGAVKQGQIAAWQAQIVFDPDALDQAYAQVVVDAGSITYDDPYVSGAIPGDDGLDVANHPQIKVVLDQFTPQGETYQARGTLTIKDISLDVDVDFTYQEMEGQAHVTGQAQIDRRHFNIGTKTDGNGRYLGTTVQIDFVLMASRQSARQSASP